jgi:alpha-L-rhamnosidase
MRIGELRNADGTVSQGGTGSPMFDTYVLSGREVESWHPQFEYHGFRYVQVTGLPASPDNETISGLVLRGANEAASSFTSSNQLLNDIHRIIDRAIQSNMLSIFTDCPDREKLGWLADMQLIFSSITRNYDVAAYMRTVVRNMAEAQTAEGLVPDFVPEYTVYDGGFRDDPNWGNTMILAPWDLYVTYGDIRTVETYYPNMQRYLAYLGRQAHNSLLDYGLGDWNSAAPGLAVGVTATYGYYRAADIMARTAGLLGRTEDARAYAALVQNIAAAFNARYLDPANHTYAGGQQGADALALDMGIVPDNQREAVLAHLIASIRAAGNHALVGIVALPAVFRALSAAGRDDVVYDIAIQTTNPSYGYQLSRGATSLAEDWRGADTDASQNHMMLGAIEEWFTAGLAGIQQAPGAAGYETLVIKPAILGRLAHMKGSYQTPNGEVICEWTRQTRGYHLDVTIPDNTTATIYVPVSGRISATAEKDAQPLGSKDGPAIYRVGPGRYSFHTGLRR